jgi:hypothetical protein
MNIEIERARTEGIHEGIQRVILEIEKIESVNDMLRQVTCAEFISLKNKLGMLIHKNWPRKN